MRRRDRQNELVVALVVAIAMAFALAFSILLSLGDDDDETPLTPVSLAPSQAASEVVTEEASATQEPSEETTEQPTEVPSEIPTEESSEIPSQEPTEEPSEVPSEEPTEEVSVAPSEEVTQEPTEKATATATIQTRDTVTASPDVVVIALDDTETPTKEPSDTPSPKPSATPTLADTDTPTDTEEPTATPTKTNTPTVTPTETATLTLTPFGKPRTLAPTLTQTPTQIEVAQVETLAIAIPTRQVTLTLASTVTPMPTQEAACVPRSDWDIYIIDVGDTFFSIAQAADVSMEELQVGNCIENTGLIYAGQPMRVPRGSSLPVTESTDAAVESCNIPDAVLTAPKPGETLTGTITLRGIASGENFRRYILDWRPDDPAVDYRSFEEIFNPVVQDGNLGRFNTDAFPPGLYWFRLRVLETNDFIIGECAIRVRFD
jgi:LysM repeat protein